MVDKKLHFLFYLLPPRHAVFIRHESTRGIADSDALRPIF